MVRTHYSPQVVCLKVFFGYLKSNPLHSKNGDLGFEVVNFNMSYFHLHSKFERISEFLGFR